MANNQGQFYNKQHYISDPMPSSHRRVPQLTSPENNVPVNGSMRMAGWTQKQETDYNAIIGGEKSMFEGLNISRQVWKEEYGDVAPRDPAMELELFGEQDGQQQRAGLDFSR